MLEGRPNNIQAKVSGAGSPQHAAHTGPSEPQACMALLARGSPWPKGLLFPHCLNVHLLPTCDGVSAVLYQRKPPLNAYFSFASTDSNVMRFFRNSLEFVPNLCISFPSY